MKRILLIIITFICAGCGHWSVTERADDKGNIWIRKGFWSWNDLYYCSTSYSDGKQKEEPKCYEAKFYHF